MSDESRRTFVDTNVLVYAYDKTAGIKGEQARRVLEGLWSTGKGALSVQVLQEFFVTVTRKLPEPVPVSTAARTIEDFGTWHVHSPTATDVLAAIEIREGRSVSFWDAMILRSAAELGCGTLWTEDLNAGEVVEGVRIANPFKE